MCERDTGENRRTKNGRRISDPSSAVLQRFAPHYDDIVASIYRAGSCIENWRAPISKLAEVFDSWVVQLLCVNKQTRAIQWAYEGGSVEPAAGVDFLRTPVKTTMMNYLFNRIAIILNS